MNRYLMDICAFTIWIVSILYTRGRCLASLIVHHHWKKKGLNDRREKSLVTQRAGPFCILQCYENLNMNCTEFLQVWILPNWLKQGEKSCASSHDRIYIKTICLLATWRKLANKSEVTFEVLQVALLCSWVCNFQPVIILGSRNAMGTDHTDHWLLRVPCFDIHTPCYRWKKNQRLC